MDLSSVNVNILDDINRRQIHRTGAMDEQAA